MPRPSKKLHKISLEEVLRNPKAKRAFELLTKKNACPTKTWELLRVAALAQFLPRSHDMFFVDGMTRDQVTNFPGLLKEIARRIECVRENLDLEVKPGADEEILNLPSSLRQYASDLEGTLRFGRAFMQKNSRYWDIASVFKLKLLNYVKQTTGAPQFSLVADLLHAAFTAARIEKEVDVDANTLRKLYTRRSTSKSHA